MTEIEWIEKLRKNERYSKFTDDQWYCCQMIFDLIGGEHHLYNKIKEWGDGIQYNTGESFSTFDYDKLTFAVFLAHDRCIRMSIESSGRGLIRVCLWKRKNRDGRLNERHPTLEQAITTYRESFPLSEVK
jgi:hypothetical protein